MKKWQRGAAATFIFIAAGAAYGAAEIGLGSFGAPGPGFFPFWLAVLMAAAAGVYYWQSRGPDDGPASAWGRERLKRPLLAVAVMLVFAHAMELVGFCTATFLLLIAWLTVVEKRSWKVAALTAVIGTVSVYVVFGYLLELPLPHGLLI